MPNERRLTLSTPRSISVGSRPTENMHLMMADMTKIKTEERCCIVTIPARDINIVDHTIPDTRPSSSVMQTHANYQCHTTSKVSYYM